jgi:3D (Asp-Asp-Asp) domain-containing protein
MPKDVRTTGYYATATKLVNHGDPCIEGGVAGIALKQQSPGWQTAFADVKKIQIGEPFLIREKGRVEVATLGGAVKGQSVFITPATNALTLTGTAPAIPFGKVVELAGQRGTPTGRMMVDLEMRDNQNTL